MTSANREQRRKEDARPTVSRRLSDGTLVELVYDPGERKTAFAMWRDGIWRLVNATTLDGGERLVPLSPNNNLIRNEIILLASAPEEYGTEQALLTEISSFIHHYVDFQPAFEAIASHYVLLTWLYDAFNEMPYLRLRGDWGSGKTRALMTLGSLCYKAFFASGASTVSPIFHILDGFGGTLVLDEADFRFSDEKAEIVKILNNGNVRGIPVLRTMQNREREFNPRAFQVFGPKIVATRASYQDQGLESRFITEHMGIRKLRPDIPINLPPAFKEEARSLRNKLLLYRFRRLSQAKLDPSLADPSLEPRLNQILLPLLSVVGDAALRSSLRAAARDAQSSLIAERGQSVEAQVLEVLAELMGTSRGRRVSVGVVAARMTERHGSEYERPLSSRWIGGILRNRLGIKTYKSDGVFIIPEQERPKVEHLCERFGAIPAGVAVAAREVGT